MVPYEIVHTDFREPAPVGHGYFAASSNGLASGNHLLEAISHGLSELIERDAMTLWQRSPARSCIERRVDLATVAAPSCQQLIEHVRAAGAELAVWDITTDIGIAAFECTLVERDTDPLRPMYPASGNGCHPSREVAFIRAVTEAIQARLTAICGARDDFLPARYLELCDPELARASRLRVLGESPTRRFEDTSSFECDGLEGDVAHQVQRLAGVGLSQIVVVDLSKPEYAIPVVRVVVPGLEAAAVFPGTYAPGPRAQRAMGAAP